MFQDQSAKKRLKELLKNFTADPVLPMLGWTKAVESVVVGGPILTWIAYSLLLTCVWVYADDIQRRAQQVSETVEEVTDQNQSDLEEYQG